jgi:Domain of unknown function (DUF3576)
MMFCSRRSRRRLGLAAVLVGAIALAGCSTENTEFAYPESQANEKLPAKYSNEKSEEGSIFGSDDGFDLFGLFGGGGDKGSGGGGGGGIGVNSYLWRASLDTVSFMPLTSADPFGGVIITDWYSPPESPGERFKMNIYILGRQLRADGVRVAVFRQAQRAGAWADASVKNETATNLENQILTRARQLRVASVSAN